MATDLAESPPEEDASEAPEAAESLPRGRFALDAKKLRVLGGLVILMLAQAGLMYFFLLDPAVDPKDEDVVAEADEVPEEGKGVATVEISIDDFSTTNSQANPGSVIHVSFDLVAIVAANEQAAFTESVKGTHKARVRQAVEKVVRGMDPQDLSDPNYGTMKRHIKSEVNRVLRKSYIIEAVISNFRIMEQ